MTPTTGGKANTNLRLDLVGGGPPSLLRFFVRDPASGAKEAAILARLAGRAPVPHLHLFAETNSETGHHTQCWNGSRAPAWSRPWRRPGWKTLWAWLDFLNRPGDHPRLFQGARQILRETMERWP